MRQRYSITVTLTDGSSSQRLLVTQPTPSAQTQKPAPNQVNEPECLETAAG